MGFQEWFRWAWQKAGLAPRHSLNPVTAFKTEDSPSTAAEGGHSESLRLPGQFQESIQPEEHRLK